MKKPAPSRPSVLTRDPMRVVAEVRLRQVQGGVQVAVDGVKDHSI